MSIKKKIEARLESAAMQVPEWFKKLSKEGQKDYLEKHPNSKLAQQVRKHVEKKSTHPVPQKTTTVKSKAFTLDVTKKEYEDLQHMGVKTEKDLKKFPINRMPKSLIKKIDKNFHAAADKKRRESLKDIAVLIENISQIKDGSILDTSKIAKFIDELQESTKECSVNQYSINALEERLTYVDKYKNKLKIGKKKVKKKLSKDMTDTLIESIDETWDKAESSSTFKATNYLARLAAKIETYGEILSGTASSRDVERFFPKFYKKYGSKMFD